MLLYAVNRLSSRCQFEHQVLYEKYESVDRDYQPALTTYIYGSNMYFMHIWIIICMIYSTQYLLLNINRL